MSVHKSLLLAMSAFLLSCAERVDAPAHKGALTQIPFEKVKIEDNFWLPRLKTQKKTLVPFSLEKTEYAVENLRLTAASLRG